MATKEGEYPATLKIDAPSGQRDRLSVLLRILWVIPIGIILALLTASGTTTHAQEASKTVTTTSMGIETGLAIATALMIAFRQRYPKWWFDFALELNRFSARVGAYLFLLTDKYPSTVETQSVHLDINYPDVKKELNQWLPLIKWLLAIPHYFVLVILSVGVLGATILAWFSILFTGEYPKGLFDFVVGVGRWTWRVSAYAFLLTTDEYPPFSLD